VRTYGKDKSERGKKMTSKNQSQKTKRGGGADDFKRRDARGNANGKQKVQTNCSRREYLELGPPRKKEGN